MQPATSREGGFKKCPKMFAAPQNTFEIIFDDNNMRATLDFSLQREITESLSRLKKTLFITHFTKLFNTN
jgi:hypothetical protein